MHGHTGLELASWDRKHNMLRMQETQLKLWGAGKWIAEAKTLERQRQGGYQWLKQHRGQ